MQDWPPWVIAAVALVALAPLAAWFGRRHGRSVRGTAGLALILLGFGRMFDPPQRNLVETLEEKEKEGVATGEPKDASGGS